MTIKELREKYNLTQSALARSLGVSSNAISGIEAGRIKLSPKMSAKIKEVYGEEFTSAATEKPSEAAATTPEKKTTTKKNRSEKKAAPEKSAAHRATPEKPAEDTDWASLYRLAKNHEVIGIVYMQCRDFMPAEHRVLFERGYSAELFYYTNRVKETERIRRGLMVAG